MDPASSIRLEPKLRPIFQGPVERKKQGNKQFKENDQKVQHPIEIFVGQRKSI